MTHPASLYAAIDATWPPASAARVGPWTVRHGAGGGKRVSAATVTGGFADTDIDAAAAAMQALDQPPLFMVTAEDAALDAALAARGYVVRDPVTLYTAPVAQLMDRPIPPVTAFAIWEPLAIMDEIWAAGGIGPARRAIMDRAACKTAILARWREKPAGVGFVARHGDIAMVHAVEVLAHQRRQGVAGWIMRRAAFWAHAAGATTLAVLCVTDNHPANTLYQGMGFVPCCGYHYRMLPEVS